MYINQIKLLYTLFFKSSNFLLKTSIFMLPIIIAISFASIFFINNLSHSYKHYLLQSYIGTQGVITIHSSNSNYLKELQEQFSTQSNSLKKELLENIVISSSKYSLEKSIKIIVLEDSYLRKRVHYTNQALAINKVLANILGDVKALSLSNPDTNSSIALQNLTVIDSGFLSVEPLIFMSKEFIESLGYKKIVFNALELDISLENIPNAKLKAIQLSEKDATDIYFKDILSQHQSSQELFDNIRYIEYIVLLITSMLSFIILTGALNIIAKIKEKAISLLRIYGLSTSLISFGLTFMSISILIIAIILAYFIFEFMKIYFIYSIDLGSNFFLPLNYIVIYIVSFIFIIFTLLTYLWAYKTFKGKIIL